MRIEPWDLDTSWNVTWGQLFFLFSGEIGLESQVSQYDQEEESEHGLWPDVDEIENWRICLCEIDLHAAEGTLEDFCKHLWEQMGGRISEHDLIENWAIEGPWIREYMNMVRVLDGPNSKDKRTAVELVSRHLGYKAPIEGKVTTMSCFSIHPREELEIVRSVAAYRRPRGRPTVPVDWGSDEAQTAMNFIRRRIGKGVPLADASRQCAQELEGNHSDNRPKYLAKLYGKKMKLRGDAAELIAGE